MKNKNSLYVATHFTPRIKLFMRQLLLDIPLRSFIRCSLFSFHFVVIGLILLCTLVLATSFARECPYVYLYDVYMNMENIGNTTKKTEFYFVTKTTFTPTFIQNNTKNNFKTFIDVLHKLLVCFALKLYNNECNERDIFDLHDTTSILHRYNCVKVA